MEKAPSYDSESGPSSFDQESDERLLAEHERGYGKEESWDDINRQSQSGRLRRFLMPLSVFLNAVLGVICIVLWVRSRWPKSPLPPWPNTLYSPAQGAVEYEIINFNSDFLEDHSGKTAFYGMSPEANKAWEDLMDPYRVQLSSEEAERISRPTSKISSDPDLYITSLDVYHQLHCLMDIRQMVIDYNTTENQLDRLQTMHKFHCIDSLRQSLMCNADLSLIHWYWSPRTQKHAPNATTTHVCRKWSKIEEWAKEHKLDEELYDPTKLIE